MNIIKYKTLIQFAFIIFTISIFALTSCGDDAKSSEKESGKNEKVTEKSSEQPKATSSNVDDTAQDSSNPESDSRFEFDATEYDFGSVNDGEIVEHTFKFKNTGKKPLVIENATATCGCTVPEYTKEPVEPGESGIIKVTFNSSGKVGIQNKPITITANSYPKINKLYLKGEVKAVPKGKGPTK